LPIKSNKLVAIIDDDLDIVELFHDALISIPGIVIFKFTDPIIALEHITINKDAYVLIISDLRMPSLNGIELVKKAKNLNHKVRTLLMTAFEISDNMFKEYIKQEVINGFLQKPIRIDDLYLEVNKQVHAHEIYG
jgi:DNA-binding NtrC family response regulator